MEYQRKEFYTISEISELISEVFKDPFFQNISIKGEIVSKQVKNGHTYLTLVDSESSSKATLKAIIFSWSNNYIKTKYQEGDEVILRGDFSYYSGFGTISLICKSVALYGEGMELVRLKRLEEKLAKEGLFDSSRKKKLPKYPSKIAIVTSSTGAAYHDIKETLKKKFPVNTVLFDALVQGVDAPRSLIKALDEADRSDADLIIFGRGGGSKVDLSCFNDENLVRKVASLNKPIISAIGHEIDRSLCDLASDVYAITPTDAANKALEDYDLIVDSIASKENFISDYLEAYINEKMMKIIYNQDKLSSYSPQKQIETNLVKLNNIDKNLNYYFIKKITELSQRIETYDLKLDMKNPLNVLERGYTLVKKDDKIVVSNKELKRGDEIEIIFLDGNIKAKVEG